MTVIYKICPKQDWEQALREGCYAGSGDDHRDGFVHFSTASQLAETLRRHFAGHAGLVLLAVEEAAAGPALKWEPSRGGDLFPHLYGALSAAAVSSVDDLPLGPDGLHRLPPLS